jgi:cytosine/uracil/thiamine/allantoin permease
MGGYTVFLGPITGIMITDASPCNHLILVVSKRVPKFTAATRLVLARTSYSCRRSLNVLARGRYRYT